MTDPILKGRLLSALRSVAIAPAGLRIGAFPKSMTKLVEMGLVEERTIAPRGRRRGWYLTPTGRAMIRERGVDEV